MLKKVKNIFNKLFSKNGKTNRAEEYIRASEGRHLLWKHYGLGLDIKTWNKWDDDKKQVFLSQCERFEDDEIQKMALANGNYVINALLSIEDDDGELLARLMTVSAMLKEKGKIKGGV